MTLRPLIHSGFSFVSNIVSFAWTQLDGKIDVSINKDYKVYFIAMYIIFFHFIKYTL